MPVTIEIQNLQTTIPLKRAHLTKTIRKVFKSLQLASGQVSFVFVSDAKMKTLNRKFLRHDFATDVLTFDWKEKASAFDIDGEIIISVQTAKRNALEYDASVHGEILLYMIHGILHLCGFNDKSLSDVKRMRDKEKQLMALL